MFKKYWIFAFALLSHCLEGHEAKSLANIEAEPSSFVHGCVNVITGDYIESHADLVIPGTEPLVIRRTYDSSEGGNLGGGWDRNHDCYLDIELEEVQDEAVSPMEYFKLCDENGSLLYFSQMQSLPECKVNCKVDQNCLERGVTNCSSGEISARTNHKNVTLKSHRKTHYERYFEVENGAGSNYRFDGNDDFQRISRIKKSSLNQIHYSYEKKSLKKIEIKNKSGNTVSSVKLDGVAAPFKGAHRKITSNDGRELNYMLHAGDHAIPKKFIVESNFSPGIVYSYSEHHHGSPSKIIRRELPEGRQRVIKYYRPGGNDVHGENIEIHHHDLRNNRVRKILEPMGPKGNMIEAYRFVYHIEAHGKGSNKTIRKGHTNVYDAYNHKTCYNYSGEHRLTKIEKYTGTTEHHLYTKEKLFWGAENSKEKTCLVSRTFEDQQGNILFCRHYKYDSKGNVRCNRLFGDLKGKHNPKVVVDGNGVPKKNGCDFFKLYYKYNSRNLMTLQEHYRYNIEYNYDPKSDELISKFIVANGVVCQRHFYKYDNNGAVCKEIVDNGLTRDKDNYAGVTERKIKKIKNTYKKPVGMPETIEEMYLDLATDQKILIHKTINSYDAQGHLKTQQHYGSDNLLAYTLEWDYDKMGNVFFEKNALGQITTRKFDENGNKVFEQGPNPSYHWEYTYDCANRLTKQEKVSADGQRFVEEYDYDKVGNKISSTDIYGNTTHYAYDEFGRVIKTIQPEIVDSEGNRTQPVVIQSYDPMGNVTSIINPRGETTTTAYTIHGKPYEIQHPDGTTEHFEYYRNGDLKRQYAKNGSWTDFIYDYLGRVTEKVTYDAEGVELVKTKAEYNAFHVISETDGKGHITKYCYDGAGRVMSVEKNRRITSYVYDTLNRIVETREEVDDIHYIAKIQLFDNLNRVIEERIEDDANTLASRVKYTYDVDGNRHQVITYNQAGEAIVTTHYDSLQQLIETINPLNQSTKTTYSYDHYNALGQIVFYAKTKDPLNQITYTEKDALGHVVLIERQNAAEQTIQKQQIIYNVSGQRERVIETAFAAGVPGREVITQWRYDHAGRLESLTEALGTDVEKTTTYEYNAVGQLKVIHKPNEVDVKHSYDSLGRLAKLKSSDRTVFYRYEYDANNNLKVIRDQFDNTVTEKEYDDDDYLIKETLGNRLVLQYTHDAIGRLKTITYPDQTQAMYDYSPCRLREISRLNALGEKLYTHTYNEYDLSGRVMSAQMIGQVGRITVTRDLLGRETTIDTNVWSETIDNYDAVGNLCHRVVKDSQGDISCDYTYDDLYQLKTEQGLISHDYTFDSLYNRVNKDDKAEQVNALNQLIDDAVSVYRYDANGRLKEKITEDTTVEYEYDGLDRLIVVTEGANKYYYIYDAENRRLSQTHYVLEENTWNPKEVTNYLYQGQNEIGSYNREGTLVQLRILGPGKGAEVGAAIALELEGKVYAPVHDHNGNVICLVNSVTGEEAETYRYSAFGEELFTKVIENPWRFSSKRFDEETGLIYFGRRYYDSGAGRWVTPDPLGYQAGSNLYAYVLNNPLTHFDAYGLLGLKSELRYRGPSISLSEGFGNIGRALVDLSRMPGRAIEFIGQHMIPIPGAKDVVEGMGRVFGGKTLNNFKPSWKREHSQIIFAKGSGESTNHCNEHFHGILTSYSEAVERTIEMARIKGLDVYALYSPSHGFAMDIVECLLEKVGIRTNQVIKGIQMSRMVLNAIGPEGAASVHTFSRGTETNKQSKKNLTPAERAKFEVCSYGGANFIKDDTYGYSKNYIGEHDYVSFFGNPNQYTQARSGRFSNVHFIKNDYWPFQDHTWEFYKETAYREIDRFKSEHRISQ